MGSAEVGERGDAGAARAGGGGGWVRLWRVPGGAEGACAALGEGRLGRGEVIAGRSVRPGAAREHSPGEPAAALGLLAGVRRWLRRRVLPAGPAARGRCGGGGSSASGGRPGGAGRGKPPAPASPRRWGAGPTSPRVSGCRKFGEKKVWRDWGIGWKVSEIKLFVLLFFPLFFFN